MTPRPFSTQAVDCPPCCSQARTDATGCQWVDDMLAICGGLLFVGVSRHELAAMAPCRRKRRQRDMEPQGAATEREDPELMDYPPLRLLRA